MSSLPLPAKVSAPVPAHRRGRASPARRRAFCSTMSTVVPALRMLGDDVEDVCSTMFGREPQRRLVEHHQLGPASSARGAIASICCSPPDSVPAAWLRRSANRGSCSNRRAMSVAMPVAVAAQVAAHFEVFGHGHVREDVTAFRTVRDAERAGSRRAAALVMSLPSKRSRAAGHRHEAPRSP